MEDLMRENERERKNEWPGDREKEGETEDAKESLFLQDESITLTTRTLYIDRRDPPHLMPSALGAFIASPPH